MIIILINEEGNRMSRLEIKFDIDILCLHKKHTNNLNFCK